METGLISIIEFVGKKCEPFIIAEPNENDTIQHFKSKDIAKILKIQSLGEEIDNDKKLSRDEKDFLHELCNSLINEIKAPVYNDYSQNYKKEVLANKFTEAAEKAEKLHYTKGFLGFMNNLRQVFGLEPIKIKSSEIHTKMDKFKSEIKGIKSEDEQVLSDNRKLGK